MIESVYDSGDARRFLDSLLAFFRLSIVDSVVLGSGTEREHNMEKFVRDTPLQRFGLPEEVAALAVLLASDEATYITGAELNIDGGLLAGSSSPPRR